MPEDFVLHLESATPGVALAGLYQGEPNGIHHALWGAEMDYIAPDHYRYRPRPVPLPEAPPHDFALHHFHTGPLCVPVVLRLRLPNALAAGDWLRVSLKRASDDGVLNDCRVQLTASGLPELTTINFSHLDMNQQPITWVFPADMVLTLPQQDELEELPFAVTAGEPVVLPRPARLDYLTACVLVECLNREAVRVLTLAEFRAAWPRWVAPGEALKPSRLRVSGDRMMPSFASDAPADAAAGVAVAAAEFDQQCALWAALGFNTISAQNWSREGVPLPLHEVNAIADRWGLVGRLMAKSDLLETSEVPDPQGTASGLVDGLPIAYAGLRVTDWLARSFDEQGRLDAWARAFRASGVSYYADPVQPPERPLRVGIGDEEGMELPGVLHILRFASNRDAKPHVPQELMDYVADQGLNLGGLRADWLAYLARVNPHPQHFGAEAWQELMPPDPQQHNPMNNPRATAEMARLWVWTLSFLHGQMAACFARVTRALSRSFGADDRTPRALTTLTNYNAPFRSLYLEGSSEDESSGKEAPIKPDPFLDARVNRLLSQAGLARYVVHSGRDWFSTGVYLNDSSATADLLRSAAASGGDPRCASAYVFPNAGTLLNPDDLLYRAVAFWMRGVQAIDYFSWGPWPRQGDAWSWNIRAYPQIQATQRMLARAEAHLLNGSIPRAQIAILLTRASDYLCANLKEYPLFLIERFYLHRALTHAGHAVDFIDEAAIAEGELSSYRVVYLCDPVLMSRPDLDAPAVDVIAILAAWVASGGRLVLSPGAAVMDETAAPLEAINALTGLAPRDDLARRDQGGVVQRPVKQESDQDVTNYNDDTSRGHLVELRDELGNRLEDNSGPAPAAINVMALPMSDKTQISHLDGSPLTVQPGAAVDVLGRFHHPDPPHAQLGNAFTRHSVGMGQVYCFGFFVGTTYARTARTPRWLEPLTQRELTVEVMPGGWQRSVRNWAVRPVAEAGLTPGIAVVAANGQPLAADKVIETRSISHDKGAAIGVYNWSGVEVRSDRLEVAPVDIGLRFLLLKKRNARVRASSARDGRPLSVNLSRRFSLPGEDQGLYEVRLDLPGFSTVDIVTLDVSPGLRSPSQRHVSRFSGPLRRLGGGDGGGGGLYATPSGRIIKVPPRVDKRARRGL